MFGAVGLAWLLPGPGAAGGALRPELTNKLGVALIFFLHGLTLPLAALRDGLVKLRLHLVVQLTTFVFFPLLGLALRLVLPAELASGVFYLCALPSAISSSVAMTAAARGDVPSAVFNATLSSLLGVFITPFWVSLTLGGSGQALPLGHVMLDLARWLLLPLAVGQALRPLLGSLALRYKHRLALVERGTILLLVYSSFCQSVKAHVWQSTGALPLLVALSVSVLLLAAALSTTSMICRALGFSDEERIAAVFCGSKKSLAAGVPMARMIFGARGDLSLLLLPILLYHALQLFVAGFLAARWARRDSVQRHVDS